ncbi:sensor histidine kinase [Sediminibacterium ginsengisoli]|uniref:histidine kinase n=1 Tax=Sediminibacterium ginsengisoli TaxID=413434 RepID=A0A1T4JT72_9BACT|nr:ATP-binding protein [Sediminibacterium ginsengisoli]SJZ33257.1 His Kinase A (phospho-acceptor) domain-containing protein [Sediminibacterium ginsengisoli]
MSLLKNKRLAFVTLIYWLLLAYMVAALFFWFIELDKQNQNISSIKLQELKHDDPSYYPKAVAIEEAKKRKTAQYLGEGMTFLALLTVGAIYVFRATRRQIRFSQQQQNFMMAVTHELKTPIAVTRLNLETLQKRKLDEEKQQKLIANTLQEANRLNTLCNNILLAAQLEAGGYNAARQEINLSDLIEGCIDGFQARFPQQLIIEDIMQGIYIHGEQLLLEMLVNNLLENALKYSPKETTITVSLYEEDRQVQLQVADQGYGIPDDEKGKIFDKFYRSGNENTRSAKGTGLGLYLCRKIVESHNGYISVTDNHPQGSIFAVLFQPE